MSTFHALAGSRLVAVWLDLISQITCLSSLGRDTRLRRLSSLSFLVKQPGGLGYRLHSKCSKSGLP